MASEDTIVKKLIINDITEEEFEAKKAAGELNPDEIYLTPDKTDDKLAGKVSIAQGKENAGKVLIISENGEVVPGEVAPIEPQAGASMPILTHVFADHTLNDISWLNADTFSWQSGDVYKAAYEHLVADFVAVKNESKKYIYCKWAHANGDLVDDDKKYYRAPEYDSLSAIEGYSIAWRPNDSAMVAVTNTETPVESDLVYYIEPVDGLYMMKGRVREASADGWEKETIDGVTVYYIVAPDGHKICVQDNEANVQALYEKTGVAWYYILDIGNKQFKLPRTKHAFTGLRDTVGGYVPAGLPNITSGSAKVMAWYADTATWEQGALKKTDANNGNMSTTGLWSYSGATDFKASYENPIYGNSNTVQPPATQMYLYFYVGNFEREAIEQTAGITSEQLNNKADVSTVESLRNAENFTAAGKVTLSGFGMPSSKIFEFSSGESGLAYTMPADGYLQVIADSFDAKGNIIIANNTTSIHTSVTGAYSNFTMYAVAPVRKGDVVNVWFNYSTLKRVRFNYAEGSK